MVRDVSNGIFAATGQATTNNNPSDANDVDETWTNDKVRLIPRLKPSYPVTTNTLSSNSLRLLVPASDAAHRFYQAIWRSP